MSHISSSLLQDFHLLDKLAHFDRERIPERVVHAKGAGAYGTFEVTYPEMGRYTKAKLFEKAGKKTPVFLRFSTVGGEKGSADTERDPRGFAIKFYTEEGNWDMTGNNTPVFFIRDPSKFPDFIHTQKKHPQTNLKDSDMFWDFLSLTPESLHQVTILFSDRGIPDGFRFQHGFSTHAFRLVNQKGEGFLAKFHFKSDQGIKNLHADKAAALAGIDPDYGTRDLFGAIERKEFPSWTVKMQIFPEHEPFPYSFNPLDPTKIWPYERFPLIEIGKLVLNRNPQNYFSETEQCAFSPSHLVPGIEPSNDRLLQGRLFSYPDTHRHRLGVNYKQIPINRPLRCPVAHHQRDGFMAVDGNFGSMPNYEPNSFNGPKPIRTEVKAMSGLQLNGTVGRHDQPIRSFDFEQPAKLFKIQGSDGQQRLIANMAKAMSGAKPFIQNREINVIRRADRRWAASIEQEIAKINGSRL